MKIDKIYSLKVLSVQLASAGYDIKTGNHYFEVEIPTEILVGVKKTKIKGFDDHIPIQSIRISEGFEIVNEFEKEPLRAQLFVISGKFISGYKEVSFVTCSAFFQDALGEILEELGYLQLGHRHTIDNVLESRSN